MEEERDLYPGEISMEAFKDKVKAKVNQIKRHWIAILGISILFGLAGWVYARQLPEYYVANVVFVLSNSNPQPNQNNLIAQQLGLSRQNNAEVGLFTIQNFLGLLTHRKMIKETLLRYYPGNNAVTFANQYLKLKGIKNTQITGKDLSNSDKDEVYLMRSLVEEIKPQLMVKSSDDGTSFTEFSGRFEHEEFAKFFTEALLDYTLQFYVEGKTKEIRKNLEQTEMRKDSLLRLLINKSRNIARRSVQSIDLNPAYGATIVENQVIGNENEFIGKLYAETLVSLETLRGELRQQTPLFTLIEKAETPLPLEVQPTLKWFWAMLVLGMLGSILVFGFKG
jgi:hypothetical protein